MDFKKIDYRNIPVQGDILGKIIALDPNANNCFRDLDNYVQSDQGVATLVLRVANSALYNRGSKITTIPKSITVLGFNVVRSLAMLAFSRSLFSQTNNPMFRKHIWHRSLLVAITGRTICKELNSESGDEAFLAGLMHDMGKLLLFTLDSGRFLQVLDLVLDHGYGYIQAEEQLFGCNHCQVGGEAVSQWQLPERFTIYMGNDLNSVPDHIEGNSDVLQSLCCAIRLIGDLGFGNPLFEDVACRKDRLQAFGLPLPLLEYLLSEDFLGEIMEDDIFKLCANF